MKKTQTVNGNLVINVKVNGCISDIHFRNGRKERSTKCFNGVEAEINLRFDNLKCDLESVISGTIKQGVEKATSNVVSPDAPKSDKSPYTYKISNPLDIDKAEQYISRTCDEDRLKAVLGTRLYNNLVHILSMDLPVRFIDRILRFCNDIVESVVNPAVSLSKVDDITYKCNDMSKHLGIYKYHLSPKDISFINEFINDIGKVSKNQIR
jgi:hypothetical protein